MLEKLEREARGAWSLVKINVDEQQELAQAFAIRSIPSLKLVFQGQLLGELTGALPEAQMKQWLKQHLELVGLTDEPEEDENLAEAGLEGIKQLQAQGNLAAAYQAAKQFHGNEPADPEGLMLTAVLATQFEPAVARALLENFDASHPYSLQADYARTLLQLADEAAATAEVPAGPQRDTYLAGLLAYAAQDWEQALERFIQVIQLDKPYHNEAARKACLGIFTLLGSHNPATQKYRRRFDMSLY
jgi:putative thioredoxin